MSVGRFTEWRSLIDGQKVGAIPDSVVDNFELEDSDPMGVYEDGETLSDYYTTEGDASFDDYELNTERAVSGNRSLRSTGDDDSDSIFSQPDDGLNRYPTKGEVFQCYVWVDSDTRFNMGFGIDSSGDGYYCCPTAERESLRITKNDGYFNGETLESTSEGDVNYPSDDWVVAEVEWHDGSGSESDNTIVASVYDTDEDDEKDSLLASISATDDEYAEYEGIAWSFNNASGGIAWADQYEVIGHVSD